MKYLICFATMLVIVLSSIQQSTTHAQTAPSALPPYPNTIRVLFVRRDDDDNPIPRDGPYEVLSGPTAISFEGDYLPNVVRQEMGDNAMSQAKEVQAIVMLPEK